jgi:hypothetical protein
MEKLKVGDKVYNVSINRFSSFINYNLDEVVRLTKTQAVLKSGTKLINEIFTDWNREKCFCEYGDRYNKWYFQNEEILLKARKENERKFIYNWFNNRKFTEDEKRIIYLKFKELNILDNDSEK